MGHTDPDKQVDRLTQLPIQLSVQVCGQSMKLDQFLGWTPGTIVSFDHSPSTSLRIRIGQRDLGRGQAVKIGSKRGIRIQQLGDPARVDETSE